MADSKESVYALASSLLQGVGGKEATMEENISRSLNALTIESMKLQAHHQDTLQKVNANASSILASASQFESHQVSHDPCAEIMFNMPQDEEGEEATKWPESALFQSHIDQPKDVVSSLVKTSFLEIIEVGARIEKCKQMGQEIEHFERRV
jgi:hypothetical protein